MQARPDEGEDLSIFTDECHLATLQTIVRRYIRECHEGTLSTEKKQHTQTTFEETRAQIHNPTLKEFANFRSMTHHYWQEFLTED